MNDRAGAGLALRLQRAEGVANRILAGVAVTLLSASAAMAVAAVAMRYLFGISSDLIEELCRFTVVYAALLYLGPLITRNAHLTMGLFTDMLSPEAARRYDLVIHALVALLLAGLFVAAWNWEAGIFAMGMSTMSGAMPAWIPSAALPLGVGIGFLYALLRVIYRVAGIPLAATERVPE